LTLFLNKFRIKSARLPDFDYSMNGMYFITICTKGRLPFFGEIVDGGMKINSVGTIVEECWFDLPNHYPNLILDEFVVMPNHIHGIMIIDNSRFIKTEITAVVETGLRPVSEFRETGSSKNTETGLRPVSTGNLNTNSPKIHGIFEFVRALKSFSSRRINELTDNRENKSIWQSRFHDRIIRNDEELWNVRNYINNNPVNWENDNLMTES